MAKTEQKQCPICHRVLVKTPYGPEGYVCRCVCGYKEVLASVAMSVEDAKKLQSLHKML